ncbi:MAG: PEP-CTERM sorting domain-containing protein [Phycisphaerales bacterium JB063]
MKLQSLTPHCLLAATALSGASAVHAEILTTFTDGDDWSIVRNGSVTENRILVKNTDDTTFDPGVDRIGVVQFSGLMLSPVTAASVRVDIERTAESNNYLAGETLSLWGVADGDAQEGITQADAWDTISYISPDGDATNNNLLDSALVFLGSITFAADTSGDVIDFFGPSVTSFVQADTNGLLTFLLTNEGNTANDDTVLFYNEDSTADAGQSYPALLTNADAVVPEPGSLALLAAGGFMLRRRRQ